MTARRVFASACIVAAAVLSGPNMLHPGFNSADAIVIVAPFALVAVWLRPQRSQTPAEGEAPQASVMSPLVTVPSAGPSPEVGQ